MAPLLLDLRHLGLNCEGPAKAQFRQLKLLTCMPLPDRADPSCLNMTTALSVTPVGYCIAVTV